MQIKLIALGSKMPNWVATAFKEYQTRLPKDYQLTLHEIALQKRTKSSDLKCILQQEQAAIDKLIPADTLSVALDRLGSRINTHEIAHSLLHWHDQNQDIAVVIGGPEGLSRDWLDNAHSIWSLSDLTLPHPMVRVIIAEQIYRAWSILSNHPYHR